MQITVLVDNRPGVEGCQTEHGLSLLIEYSGKKILLDSGQSDFFCKNAELLGIDLDAVKLMVLSHGHYDHGNGLGSVRGKKLYCHPDCFLKRVAIEDHTRDLSVKYSLEEISEKNEVILKDAPFEIAPDIYFLTNVPRRFPFEAKAFPSVLEDGSEDLIYDDGGIVINAPEGVVVITGCAHSGICNIVEYAKEICGNDKVHAVIGGFHLRRVDDDLNKTIDYLNSLKAEYILTGHCTCDKAGDILLQRIAPPTQMGILGAGKSYTI